MLLSDSLFSHVMTETTNPAAWPLTTATVATDREMRALGRRLAENLRSGDLVVLSGPLGAGKTTLTQGLAEGLHVRGPITSPTFVLARTHPPLAGGPSLVHVDAYRIGDAVELDDLDLDTELPDSVTVIEWGAELAEGLADQRLDIAIERHPDDRRTVHMTGVGSRWRYGSNRFGG